MSTNGLTPGQLEALLQFAAQKLGVSPEQLAKTVQTGDSSELGLPPDKADKLAGFLNNRSALEQLLRSPQAQQLLQQLTGKQGE
ncbi:MAG: hypothetical protein IJN07_06360 [Clostridia bacterium]|nr:hypothetical protein [Clostridia bacterium]